ncbi:protease propeptide/inhibitor [Russula ochroleuca]|uniref:Protease propeptide/inhibitor n=1 Tax=Russula ochroleuca TaxID=152965 RepID=A0A9P5TBJ8_9AGAM|nr:protease propeptide/inhibitor [Russula ochroleuca]
MSQRYIVVFKKTASQEAIDKQADEVNRNGGSVKNRYSVGLKGFSAVIPENILLQLQNSLQSSDNQIDYIGKAKAI